MKIEDPDNFISIVLAKFKHIINVDINASLTFSFKFIKFEHFYGTFMTSCSEFCILIYKKRNLRQTTKILLNSC